MDNDKYLEKYFPDYKEKGLSEPKFSLEDRVIVKSRSSTQEVRGFIVDIDTTEGSVSPEIKPEWQYFVEMGDYGYGTFCESELTLVETELMPYWEL